MNKIAVQNLELIIDLDDNIDEYNIIIEGNKISQSTDENYEGLVELRELEYPIYFSFHQLMNSIRYSNFYKIEGYRTKELIDLIDEAIEKLVDILSNSEDDPHNQVICNIIDDIDDKFIVLRERAFTCSFWKTYEIFNDYLDTFSNALLEGGKYLYTTNRFEEFFEDSDGESEGADAEDEKNNETEEMNPNLVYDIYKKDN